MGKKVWEGFALRPLLQPGGQVVAQAGGRHAQVRGLGGRESISPDQSVPDPNWSAGHAVQLITDEALAFGGPGPGLGGVGGAAGLLQATQGGFLAGLSPGPLSAWLFWGHRAPHPRHPKAAAPSYLGPGASDPWLPPAAPPLSSRGAPGGRAAVPAPAPTPPRTAGCRGASQTEARGPRGAVPVSGRRHQ